MTAADQIREYVVHCIEKNDAADVDSTWEHQVLAALDEHAAELARAQQEIETQKSVAHGFKVGVMLTMQERDEARAENERLRDHLDVVLGFVNRRTLVTVVCEDIDDVMDALDAAEAALAAAQEPPVTVTPILASCFMHGDHAGDECPECKAKRSVAAQEPTAEKPWVGCCKTPGYCQMNGPCDRLECAEPPAEGSDR